MKQRKKLLTVILFIFIFTNSITPAIKAMHIMEGYLPLKYCISWGVISIPFLILGFSKIRKIIEKNRKMITVLAIVGAFIFVVSSLKIPSVTGSCSHMTGTGLGAILFGPSVVSILGIIVLLFQAILLAHGGLTTLGANTFSMAIAGPILSYVLYKLGCKLKINKRISVFIGAFLGDLFTYCITSVQLGMAYPSKVGGTFSSIIKFLGVFAPTQIPLAIIEGLLTVVIFIALENYAKPEIDELLEVKGVVSNE